MVAGWVHLRAGVPPDRALFVAGLAGPLPAAADLLAVFGGAPGGWSTWGSALVLTMRALAGVALVVVAGPRVTAPGAGARDAGLARRLVICALVLVLIDLGAGIVAVVAGIVAGSLLAVLHLLAAMAVWAWLAARMAGRVPGRRVPLAAIVTAAIALLLTTSGPAPPGDALAMAALAGCESSALLLAALRLGRPCPSSAPARPSGRQRRKPVGRAG
jgi:hypothetical protein